jgi:hypothetical protein
MHYFGRDLRSTCPLLCPTTEAGNPHLFFNPCYETTWEGITTAPSWPESPTVHCVSIVDILVKVDSGRVDGR